ncbi:hypothetical protein BC936DRAFT_138303 [Jimgerdemannia flammicorona]|uniref:HSac2 domain-containing protein n=1 Tax=Jimgerdemannia flammicorona TaxID=994334 RepID=A0A433DIG9_9FUNG|nr:hypothetical protein BC936DRAFT_138303 [Jimgerdemannia flammicorona]
MLCFVWANNGDTISREYAGTSALKGDFTRTGKRNITGMMNDASNSLARMYHNTVKDFWRQATIDYMLGYHKIEIFRLVPQSTMMSAEPGVELRWQKVRANAIDISSGIVISDGEEKIDGWTLLSPVEPNIRRGRSFEEKVFLLTKKAIYICSFHYSLEKVVQFKRIGLQTITRLVKGEYVLSTADAISTSPENNYGFLLYYDTEGESIRINSGSIRNSRSNEFSVAAVEAEVATAVGAEEEAFKDGTFLAFKAVRYNILGELPEHEVRNCQQQVEDIVKKITEACKALKRGSLGKDEFVIDRPIIR